MLCRNMKACLGEKELFLSTSPLCQHLHLLPTCLSLLRTLDYILKCWQQTLKNKKTMQGSHHHKLLELVESVVVSPTLQQLAGGDKVTAAYFQTGIQRL